MERKFPEQKKYSPFNRFADGLMLGLLTQFPKLYLDLSFQSNRIMKVLNLTILRVYSFWLSLRFHSDKIR